MTEGVEMSIVTELRKLKKIGDESATQVAETISQMVGNSEMKVSSVNLTAIPAIPQSLGLSEKKLVGLFVRFSGEISGALLCMIDINGAKKLANIMLQGIEEENSEEFTEMQQSAVTEICNIITSSFIDVWANKFSLELSHTPPVLAYDYADSIVDTALVYAATKDDFAITFNNDLVISEIDGISFNIIVLPDPNKLDVIFKKLEPLPAA